ncbi:efflux RND transporter periplasmic adaptor subunit [Algibacter luteus]|uniref:efflux RND transporter periplasmic adaptor subunit n=1 Tax=Algibacter luteus TaxID=1178825 RepID=UPI002593B137|nr:HlyD family efflux transporter periplasmic adaptor subunit [Algibacter luteus]WJJ95771.1 HlyD family efflux transporter periplasmic adaptor subunit [Algibacter luteus]
MNKYPVFLIVFILVTSCLKNSDYIFPEKKNLTESIYASATIQPDSLYQVYAAVGGILDANLLEEGSLISKNQPLIQIINNTPKLNTQNAKLALDLAEENYNGNAAILSSITDEINAAELKFINDSINYFRQKNLWDQNIGSKVIFDTKKLNYQLAFNNLQTLKSKYSRTKNELETTLKQATNNYQSSLINTKDFTVKSKIDGKVYALYKNPGEIISTLEPLAAIGSAKTFIIKLLVDEVDIVKISKNQEVLLSLDAYKNTVFTGKISKILPKKDERNQTFTVEAYFDNPPNVLYPGLSGEANIVISNKKDVLTIPKVYVIEGDKIKTDEGIITIHTGLQNMEIVEVISGVSESTRIYKPE